MTNDKIKNELYGLWLYINNCMDRLFFCKLIPEAEKFGYGKEETWQRQHALLEAAEQVKKELRIIKEQQLDERFDKND